MPKRTINSTTNWDILAFTATRSPGQKKRWQNIAPLSWRWCCCKHTTVLHLVFCKKTVNNVCAFFNRNRTAKLRANRVRHRNHFSDGWMAKLQGCNVTLEDVDIQICLPKRYEINGYKRYVEVACIANMLCFFYVSFWQTNHQWWECGSFQAKLYPSSNGPFLSTSMNCWPCAIYHPSSSTYHGNLRVPPQSYPRQ